MTPSGRANVNISGWMADNSGKQAVEEKKEFKHEPPAQIAEDKPEPEQPTPEVSIHTVDMLIYSYLKWLHLVSNFDEDVIKELKKRKKLYDFYWKFQASLLDGKLQLKDNLKRPATKLFPSG